MIVEAGGYILLRAITNHPSPPPTKDEIMGDEYEVPTKMATAGGGGGGGGVSPPPASRTSMPSPFASTELSTRRLRSNSGGPAPHEEYLRKLTAAEMNSIAPPAPVHKIVLTGGPCGGKTTALARVSRRPFLSRRRWVYYFAERVFQLARGLPFFRSNDRNAVADVHIFVARILAGNRIRSNERCICDSTLERPSAYSQT
jgi:hypothetical protein